MQYKWLNKQGNKNLIVFFNGWGMNEKAVEHLSFGRFDVLIFFDYRTFEISDFDFSEYENKILVAWSMGVYVCNYYYEKFKDFNKFIAINGTQKPIDDKFGIPTAIYNLTVENFNDLSCAKFMKKISNKLEPCGRTTVELKDELISIRDLKVDKLLNFDEAIVSTKDRIIPSQNQMNYWKNAKQTDGAHYIFDLYTSWEELV